MSWLIKPLAILAALYVVLVLAAYLGQRRLMYFPDTARTPPSAEGLENVEEVVLEAPDGARVIAWWTKAKPGQPTLLYFHGNGGSLAFRAERVRRYQGYGRGLFMMSYRGFSGGTGDASEAANVADALMAYDHLRRQGIAQRDIILYGESLGSGVAVQVAAQRAVSGVILDAPYTSAVDIGVSAYPFLPVRWLMKDRYESARHIASVKAPILIIHGERDRIIPVEMGRRLFALAPEPKQLVTFPEADHDDHYMHGSYEAIGRWIDKLRRS